MIDRASLALWTVGTIVGFAVMVIGGVLWWVHHDTVRAGLAALMRTVGRPVLRWLDQGGRDDH